jgi:outer membrane immunogenic protein
MLKSRVMAMLCAAIGLGSATVQAQETYDWSGFYTGIFGGYNAGDALYNIEDPLSPRFFFGRPEIAGFLGGANVGVNYQLENGIVIGAEADIAAGSTRGSAHMYNTVTGAMEPVTIEGAIGPTASLRARAGFAFDRFLPFVTGGATLAQSSYSFSQPPLIVPGLEQVQLGWTAGAGLEYAVTENISAKASPAASPALVGTEKASFHTHDARIGLNYHF